MTFYKNNEFYLKEKHGNQGTVLAQVSSKYMRRLIWGFAGRTYYIVGKLMHWHIIYFCVK